VHVRSDKIRFRSNESTLVVDARISPLANGRLKATMALRRRDGTVLTRTIQAGNCEQAIDALALVTAVTLDPSAVVRDDPARTDNDGGRPVSRTEGGAVPRTDALGDKPVTQNVDAPPTREKPSTVTETKGENEERPTESPSSQAPSERDANLEWALDLSVLGHRGAAPGWMLGAEFGFGMSLLRDSMLSPSLRLGLAQTQRNDVRAEGGLADFSLSLMVLDGCPLRASLAPLELRTCAVLEVGRMASSGHQTVKPEAHQRLWLATGAGAELSLRLARHWAVGLQGRSVFPLIRDTYQFAPAAFHDTPVAVLAAQAGLSYRFQ
jgi:hypothetical protein